MQDGKCVATADLAAPSGVDPSEVLAGSDEPAPEAGLAPATELTAEQQTAEDAKVKAFFDGISSTIVKCDKATPCQAVEGVEYDCGAYFVDDVVRAEGCVAKSECGTGTETHKDNTFGVRLGNNGVMKIKCGDQLAAAGRLAAVAALAASLALSM